MEFDQLVELLSRLVLSDSDFIAPEKVRVHLSVVMTPDEYEEFKKLF